MLAAPYRSLEASIEHARLALDSDPTPTLRAGADVSSSRSRRRSRLRSAACGEWANQRLRDLRLLFQYAEVDTFCEPIERLSGRKVRAFISGIDTQADLATEMFVLHPRGYDGPARGERAIG